MANKVTTISAAFPLFTALTTPKNTPKGMLIKNAAKDKNKVMGMRSASTSTVLL